jgi:predicted metal-dependent HD superfamily phosphohydrolase
MELTLERWAGLLDRMSIAPDRTTYKRLIESYSESHRKYHNAVHISDCLAQWDLCNVAAEEPDEVELSIWFHDAIYDLHAPDNEAQSANWASRFLRDQSVTNVDAENSDPDNRRRKSTRTNALEIGSDDEDSACQRVARNIMATVHDQRPERLDEQIVVDIDLSILGRSVAEYDQFETRILDEYSWVPTNVFNPKRAEILGSFLARSQIYSTDWFAERYEQQARENLTRRISSLLDRAE